MSEVDGSVEACCHHFVPIWIKFGPRARAPPGDLTADIDRIPGGRDTNLLI